MWPLTDSRRNAIFRGVLLVLGECCSFGRAGIPVNGEGLADAYCRYTMHSGAERSQGHKNVYVEFFLVLP